MVFVRLPAVITADLRLNEPRYASLPAIMKARRRPLERLALAKLDVTVERKVEIVEMEKVSSRRDCIRVNSADELIDWLREAGVI